MNANELADAIRGCGDCSYNEDAYIMLRQQQAEIEALKAHPAELTDEEINEIAKIHYWTMNEECKFDAISFARAILRKAQER